MVAAFGPAEDRTSEEAKEDDDNPFPEPEVDEVRAQRDIALAQFLQERERRETLQRKMAVEGETKEAGTGEIDETQAEDRPKRPARK